METTYAYDFPDLFKNNTIAIWREHRATCTQPNCVHPLDSEVCTYQELVLDEDGMLKILLMQSRNYIDTESYLLHMSAIVYYLHKHT